MTLLRVSSAPSFIPLMSEKSLSELGELLKTYIKRSGKTQRQVAEETGIPSPTYLSQMANARVNWVASEYFRPLTKALGLSVAEIADLNPDLIVTEEAFPNRNGSPIPPVVAPIDVVLEIPDELKELIATHAHQPGYEALRNPKTVQILAIRRAYMGEEDSLQTVEQWRDYFLDMRRWLPK